MRLWSIPARFAQRTGGESLLRRAALLVGLLAALCGTVALPGGGLVRGSFAQPREVDFIDRNTGNALRIQVELNVPQPGAFVFRVPGRGIYVGHANAITPLAGGSLLVTHSGPAVRRPDVSLVNPAGGNGLPAEVTITLQATVNPDNHTATATLTEGAASFQLVADPLGAGPIALTLVLFENAAVTGQWTILYTLLNSDLTRANTASQFAAQMEQTAAALGPIMAIRRQATGPVRIDDRGVAFVVVGYEVDRRPAGGATATRRYDAYFLTEGSAWKLWHMDAR